MIRTKKDFTNFELLVAWRHLKKAGNSGVFLWTIPESIEKLEKGKGRLPQGIEVQILDLGYIRAINGEVRLWVNGVEVSGGTNCVPSTGSLCLESEGSPLEFRKLRIRELP